MNFLKRRMHCFRIGVVLLIILSLMAAITGVIAADGEPMPEEDLPEFALEDCVLLGFWMVFRADKSSCNVEEELELFEGSIQFGPPCLKCAYGSDEDSTNVCFVIIHDVDTEKLKDIIEKTAGEFMFPSGGGEGVLDVVPWTEENNRFSSLLKSTSEEGLIKVFYLGGRGRLSRDHYAILTVGAGTDQDFNSDQEFIAVFEDLEQHAMDVIDSKEVEEQEEEEVQDFTVTLGYYPGNPSIFNPMDFDARVAPSVNCAGSCIYEWYVDGELRLSETGGHVHGFTWEKLPIGGDHTVMVKVTDSEGNTAEASVSFTIPKPWVYLQVMSGGVYKNGELLEEGGRYEISSSYPLDRITTSSWLSPGYGFLKYDDGTILKVEPGSDVTMTSEGVYLEIGGIWYFAEKRGRTFVVDTPTAATRPKGTEFEVIVEEDGTTIVNVFDGVVDVFDLDQTKTVSVNSGETTTCEPGGLPSDPASFDPESLDRWWESFPDELDLGEPTPTPTSTPGPSTGSDNGFNSTVVIVPLVVIAVIGLAAVVLSRKRRA